MNLDILERSILKLSSLGQILTYLTNIEGKTIRNECLADLGGLIEDQAKIAIDQLDELENEVR